MPSNRRSRRSFEKKMRSGAFKACGAAASLAALFAAQLGAAPSASAAVQTFSVKYAGEDFGVGPHGGRDDAHPGENFLSLRDAVKYARTGDTIDLGTIETGDDEINVFVDGKITIDKSVTFVNSSDKRVVIHSYARSASSWYTDLDNTGIADFNNNARVDIFDNETLHWGDDIDWYTNNADTIVGNTIFDIVASNPGHSEETDATHVFFDNVTISGNAFVDPEASETSTNHNYAPLITVDEMHSGSVTFSDSVITDIYLTSFYDFFDGDTRTFSSKLAAASAVANYSDNGTEIAFINESELTDSFINTVADWNGQFANRTWEYNGDTDHLDSWLEVFNDENSDLFESSNGTSSVVFSKTGDVTFSESLAEQNYVDTFHDDHDWDSIDFRFDDYSTSGWVATWGLTARGTVFGLQDGNLTINGESFLASNENHADSYSGWYEGPFSMERSEAGVGYLENGNLYITTDNANVIDGDHIEIYSNYLEDGDGGAFALAYGRFEITGDVRFLGNVADDGDGGAIYLGTNETDEASLISGGVDFTSNYAGEEGGAIWNHGELEIGSNSLTEVLFSENVSDGSNGGAIHTGWGNLTIANTSFIGNSAVGDAEGGAVYIHGEGLQGEGLSVQIDNSTFTNNSADSEGGAIYANIWATYDFETETVVSGELLITSSNFTGNTAGDSEGDYYDGGALFANGYMEVEIAYSSFTNNFASEDGGAIYLDLRDEQALIRDSQFTNNRALDDAGAVYAASGTYLDVESTIFTYNVAVDGDGCAIDFDEEATVSGSIFTGNIASDEGGAIWTDESLRVYDSNFDSNGKEIREDATSNNPLVAGFVYDVGVEGNVSTGNFTTFGGAIWSDDSLVVRGVQFDGNTAEDDGGAIFKSSGYSSLWAIDSTFSENGARNDGGAVYFGGEGGAYFVNNTFSGNAADEDGSSIWAENWPFNRVFLVHSTIVNDGISMAVDGLDSIGQAYTSVFGGTVYVMNSIVVDSQGFGGQYTIDATNNLTSYDYFDETIFEADGPSTEETNSIDQLSFNDFAFATNAPVDNGGPVKTLKIGKDSVAVKYVKVRDQDYATDLDWLLDGLKVTLDSTELSIAELIKVDARGERRGGLADVGAYEHSISSNGIGGGGGGGGTVEPTPTPTPTPTDPAPLEPVVVDVKGFAPGSPALTKGIKAKIAKAVQNYSEYGAVVLRGFTVTKADLSLAKSRALNVKNYILKLVPGMATKVLKGKVDVSRKVKLTFKETL